MKRPVLPFAIAAAMAFLTSSVSGQEVYTGTGRPVNFDLGYGVLTHPGSSLIQQWYTVADPNLPVSITSDSFDGLEIAYMDRNYVFSADLGIDVSEPVAAVEIVIIPFDVFNDAGRPLSLYHVEDFAVGTSKVDGKWNVFSEAEAINTLTSFAYVNRVRLASGEVVSADQSFVLEQARKISAGLVVADIDPDAQGDDQ